jgi:hypothetical protein
MHQRFRSRRLHVNVSGICSSSEGLDYIYLNWVLSDVIDEIVISPYADENYEDLVRHVLLTQRIRCSQIVWCCQYYMNDSILPTSDGRRR